MAGAAAAAATLIGSSSAVAVLDSMRLTPTMASTDFSKIPLIPLEFTVGVQEGELLMARDAILKHTGQAGSIVFVVRRPGCVLCREHGQQLLNISLQDSSPFEGFELFGVVKETGVVSEILRFDVK